MTLVQTIVGRTRDLGEGFIVRRVLPAGRRQMVGPFIFFDQMGPTRFAPGEGLDVRPHPHVGLATVTYLFEGTIRHRDSLGVLQDIRPGDVNWMTAGRGIVHSERTPPELRATGSGVSGLQSWLALPRTHEDAPPAFVHHPAATLPRLALDGVELRVIAGEAFGRRSPVETFMPTLYVDAVLMPGAAFEVPAEHVERAVYVAEGTATVHGTRCAAGELAVLGPGEPVVVEAVAGARVMLLGGDPMDGPRHIWWNFVASSDERIERARDDWRRHPDGRFGAIPGESEFIPLPEK